MKKIIFLFFLLLLFLIYLISFLFLNKNKNDSKKIIPTPTETKAVGKIWLKTEKKILPINQSFKVLVYADSAKNFITGFDIVLNYDNKKLKFKSLNSLIKDYQIFTQNKENELSIIGIKPPQLETLKIFKNTLLFEIFFLPQKKGELELKFKFLPNAKNDSNLINNVSQDILNEVKGLKLEIK